MNELPKQAAELLANARSRHSASAQELQRGLARLHAQLEFSDGGADFGGDDVATQAQPWSSTSAHGFFASKLVKLTLSALALSGAVGLTYLAYPSRAPSRAPSATQQASAEPTQVEVANTETSVAPLTSKRAQAATPAPPAAADAPTQVSDNTVARKQAQTSARAAATRALRSQREAPTSAHSASAARAETTSARAEATPADERTAERTANKPTTDEPSAAPDARTAAVDESALAELDLIDEALARLRKRDPAAALTLLETHARRHPAGKLSVERRGLHVVSLCASGRLSEGRAAQEAFLARDGNAPIAERVRRACKEQER